MTRQKQKTKPRVPPLLGAHFSIAKGLHQAFYTARDYGCTAMQIFTKNASTWKERLVSTGEIELFEIARSETGIARVAAHTSYLINIASPDRLKHRKSRDALIQELRRSIALGIDYVVLHPGAHMGMGVKKGLARVAQTIRFIFETTDLSGCRLLLETTAGQGSSLGHAFEHLGAVIHQINDPQHLGVCLDTSHIFAAGYDIRKRKAYSRTMADFDRIIGLDHLYLIHLNDSKKAFGTRVDRHEHIGHGHIGEKAFDCIMNDARLIRIPKIIETPKTGGSRDWDRLNLERLRGLVRS